jgi:hypothetical protein
MSSLILFVFEGENPEKQIFKILENCFSKGSSQIKCVFGAEIYQLFNNIQNDKDLDTVSLLKKCSLTSTQLQSYKSSDFGEIYLFFDYDGHATNANDLNIIELLNIFNEETEAGKLLISYPMAEAFKHFSKHTEFKNSKVNAKDNIHYKNIVHEESYKEFIDLKKIDKEKLVILIEMHIKKMNYIVNGDYKFPEHLIPQLEIFENQFEKYINVDSSIAVLSAFPIFFLDYYGIGKIIEFLNS